MATDRQTDQQTDKADYRDAGACNSQHLKIIRLLLVSNFKIYFYNFRSFNGSTRNKKKFPRLKCPFDRYFRAFKISQSLMYLKSILEL